jgi:ribose-phosphate pyrophosphokinase
MFYKRRDYTKVVNGRNPIVAHEYLGADLKGKDVIILDDMISSGDSMLEVGSELRKRGAGRIFFCATFGLFTDGLDRFDKAYKEGLFDRVVTTNLIYQTPELLEREYYITADMSKYIALIIDTLNHDFSISEFLDPTDRIHKIIEKYNGNTGDQNTDTNGQSTDAK